MQVYLQTEEAKKILDSSRNGNEQSGRQTRDLFVQHGHISVITDATDTNELLIVPPSLLGDQTSATLLGAVKWGLAKANVNFDVLAECAPMVLAFIGIDAAPAGELTIDYLAATSKANCALFKNLCGSHGLNRTSCDYHSRCGYDAVNPLFSLSHLKRLGGYWGPFSRAVVDLATSDPDWSQGLDPDPVEEELHTAIVKLCMPGLKHESVARQAEVKEATGVLNHGWDDERRLGHRCKKDEDGIPCCSTIEQVMEKIKWAVTILLLWCVPPIPCITRWLVTHLTFGWWGLGCRLNKLFIRAFLLVYPLAAGFLQVRVEDIRPREETDSEDDIVKGED